jgi:hypothetical protein
MTKYKTHNTTSDTDTEVAINYNALGSVTTMMKDAQNIQSLTNSIFGRVWKDPQSTQLKSICDATNTSISMLQDDITKLQGFLAPYETNTDK